MNELLRQMAKKKGIESFTDEAMIIGLEVKVFDLFFWSFLRSQPNNFSLKNILLQLITSKSNNNCSIADGSQSKLFVFIQGNSKGLFSKPKL